MDTCETQNCANLSCREYAVDENLTYDWMETYLNEAKLEIDDFIEEKREQDLTRSFDRVTISSTNNVDVSSDDPKLISKYIDECISSALNELDTDFMDTQDTHIESVPSSPLSPPLAFRDDISPTPMMTTSSSDTTSVSPIAGLTKSDVSEYCSPHSSPSLNYRDTGSLKSVDLDIMNGPNGSHSATSLLTKYNQRESPINHIISNYHRNSYYDNNDEISINFLNASQIQRIIECFEQKQTEGTTVVESKQTDSSNNLFGCDINVIERLNGGLTLPPFIENALIYLLRYGINSVGIFRKSGVKSRISALRRKLEELTSGRKRALSFNSSCFAFNSGSAGDEYCVYDIADMVKCWLRELKPTPLINKEIVYAFKESRDKENSNSSFAVSLLTLLTDSQRAVLEIILQFLSWFASNASVNQMNSHNLAICLTPSLCECDGPQVAAAQSSDSCGVETEFLYDAQKCLEYLIDNCDVLSVISLNCLPNATNSDINQETDLSLDGAAKYPISAITGSPLNSTLPPKHQSIIVINASPVDILKRILYQSDVCLHLNRNLFDPTIIEWNVIEDNPSENSDVFTFKTQSSVFLPVRSFTIERRWKFLNESCSDTFSSLNRRINSNLTNAAILEEKGHLFESCWKIGVFGEGKSIVEHTAAIDYRGHSYEWYSKTFPDIHDLQLYNMNQSFLVDFIETKNVKSSEV
ncbi:hypothetical protein B4U80_07087 [Leptotrombidium deliense]|uniref:Rho-GAP domain-containing protein n=1 Tax=Leptotrombidium deliense TaxID=299467 RepID=A0A443SI18_9ACAR|nr:hypothetical protein B4U80_07087 [Leptotrombidium deliense]